jgi:cell division protein FtsI (penicillin-binding protein 3)
VQLQVFQHEELSKQARKRQQQRIAQPALRGDILDRNGEVLAYSVDADMIVADPSLVKHPEYTAAALCAALGDCSPADQTEFAAKLAAPGKYVQIRQARSVSPEQVARVSALKLSGIALKDEARRFYPRYDLAAHVLGFVGLEGHGQAGVELAYEKSVSGVSGEQWVRVDAKRTRLETRVTREPVPGATLELTLDMGLQHIAERELKAGVEANNAAGGTAIIMAPATGEVLALASYPDFNPNAVGKSSLDQRRNRATQDVYEPGSTFKIVTASAAIEEGIVSPNDLIDCNPGRITFPGRKPITEAKGHNYGLISFEDVIVKSSNIGAIKVGLRTGVEKMSKYVHRFGFGQSPTTRDFAGASRGIWSPDVLNDSGLASVSMGYQVAVTPLQMATAVSAVANGGLLMEPRVVRAVTQNGRRSVVEPKVIRRAINPETAAIVTAIMEGVVERGTATSAKIPGYRVAGKTGTANQIAEGGGYSPNEYNASFVGFVPARKPTYTILVVIDAPKAGSHYGGSVAAPIFQRIAQAALLHAGVPPSLDPIAPIIRTSDVPTIMPHGPRALVTPFMTPVSGGALMPDVRGLSAREALSTLGDAGLSVRISGSGVVATQSPEPGTPIESGGWSLLSLRRATPDPRAAGGKR